MRQIIFIGFFLFALIFSLNLVPAPGPNFHLNRTNQALLDPEVNNTRIAQLINENYDACLAGLGYPDAGIFKYYTDFRAYAELHDYNTIDEMLRLSKNDRERTMTYCAKIHLAQDGVSHNLFVPPAIRRTKIPNYIIHPIQELKIEGRYIDPRANRLMENHEEFDELVEKATGRDWSGEAAKLNVILGGGQFYSKAYNPEASTGFGRLQRWFFTIVEKTVDEETGVDLEYLALEETKAVLRGETGKLDPAGEEALRNADRETALWLYAITFILIGLIYFISFRLRWIGFSKKR